MLWLKGCPRCTGDLNEECDIYGEYTACLQCGHYLSPPEEAALYYYALPNVVDRAQARLPERRAQVAATAA